MGYVRPPVAVDWETLATEALAYIADNIAQFRADDNHLETWLVYAIARQHAETRTQFSRVFDDIFRYYGESLVRLAPVDDAPATGDTTWTMIDAAGYTIRAGTVVARRTAGDAGVAFRVVEDFVVPPGVQVTAAGAVGIEAIVPGADSNDLPPGPLELIDALAFVDTVELTQATSGGRDAETTDEYLDRLREELTLMAPRPILPDDFAILARRVPGVGRALALDNYDPDTDTWDHERMVHVKVVDTEGANLAGPLQALVQAYLEDLREVNFIVTVGDPDRTVVNVDFEVEVLPGYDPDTVVAAGIAAVTTYLDPGRWGGGAESPPQWRNDDRVRYLDLAAELDRVAGVRFPTTLTINGVAADLVLAGVAPLPTVGAITGAAA